MVGVIDLIRQNAAVHLFDVLNGLSKCDLIWVIAAYAPLLLSARGQIENSCGISVAEWLNKYHKGF